MKKRGLKVAILGAIFNRPKTATNIESQVKGAFSPKTFSWHIIFRQNFLGKKTHPRDALEGDRYPEEVYLCLLGSGNPLERIFKLNFAQKVSEKLLFLKRASELSGIFKQDGL